MRILQIIVKGKFLISLTLFLALPVLLPAMVFVSLIKAWFICYDDDISYQQAWNEVTQGRFEVVCEMAFSSSLLWLCLVVFLKVF